MIAPLLALLLASTWTATPSSDVWVYPNSSTPGGEPYLRAWGNGTKAIDTTIPPGEEFSYGYLQFDLKDIPKGDPKSATLTVWNIKNEELKDDVIKATPLEVFGLKGSFKENTYEFSDGTVGPVEPSFFKGVKIERTDDGIKMEIDLMAENGAFKKALEAARATGSLGLAIATKMSPADSRSFIYKVVSKEGAEKQRPTLNIEFE